MSDIDWKANLPFTYAEVLAKWRKRIPQSFFSRIAYGDVAKYLANEQYNEMVEEIVQRRQENFQYIGAYWLEPSPDSTQNPSVE